MRPVLTVALLAAAWGCTATAPRPAAAQSTVAPASKERPRTKKLTVEDVVSMRYVGDVALSPDSKRIAYVLRTPRAASADPGSARSIIYVVSTRGGEPRRFTPTDASSSSPRWSPDGNWILFLSKRDGDDARQVYRIKADGGEAEQVTKGKSSARSAAWSPDGKLIAYLTNRADTDDEAKAKDEGRDWELGDVRGHHRRLWTVEAATGLAKTVTERSLHVERFKWSPKGDRFLLQGGPRSDVDAVYMYSGLYVVSAKGGSAKQLTKTEGKLGGFAWSPDGTQVAFLGAADLNDPTAGVLWVVAAAGGKARALTLEYEGTGQAVWWPKGDGVVMLANEGARTVLSRVGVKQGRIKPLLQSGPVCRIGDMSADGRRFACAGSTANHPREVFVSGNRLARLKRLTDSNPWLANKQLGQRRIISWKAADGLEITGVVTMPVGYQEGTRYPLAILPHGGPEGVSLDEFNTRAGYPAQLFATRGYVVLEPNYRGSQGRGVAFGKADQRDLGGKEFEDVIAGIDHLATLGLVDPNRVGMGGWSYGGYFSGLAATLHSERFKAAMVGAAITNWISFTGTTEIEHENSLVHWNLWPYEHYDLAWSRSPMAHAAKSKTATLIVHGADDTRVPPEQATELYRALKHFGVATELVMYPREGHGLGERAHQADFARRFLDWFDKHVKG